MQATDTLNKTGRKPFAEIEDDQEFHRDDFRNRLPVLTEKDIMDNIADELSLEALSKLSVLTEQLNSKVKKMEAESIGRFTPSIDDAIKDISYDKPDLKPTLDEESLAKKYEPS